MLGLATWRLSILLIQDDGPFLVFSRLRRAVGADRPGEVTGLAFVFTCIYCMSVWVGIALWLAFVRDGNPVLYIASYSALAVGFHKLQQ